MSVIKKMEVEGTDYIITTKGERIFIVTNIEKTNKYEVFTKDKTCSLGIVTLFQEVIDLITKVDMTMRCFVKKDKGDK